MSINIFLPPDLERRLHQRVESGRYASANDVIVEALCLLDKVEASRISLREDIALGLADREAGRVVEFEPQAIKSKGRALLEPDRA